MTPQDGKTILKIGPPHTKFMRWWVLGFLPTWLVFLIFISRGMFVSDPVGVAMLSAIVFFWVAPIWCRVEIDRDGVLVVNVWRKRFQRWDDIVEVADTGTVWPQYGRALVLVLKSGKRVTAYGVTKGTFFPPFCREEYERTLSDLRSPLGTR